MSDLEKAPIAPATPVHESQAKPELSPAPSHSLVDKGPSIDKGNPSDVEVIRRRYEEDVKSDEETRPSVYRRFRPFILGGLALLILGWWISSIVIEETRTQWSVYECLDVHSLTVSSPGLCTRFGPGFSSCEGYHPYVSKVS